MTADGEIEVFEARVHGTPRRAHGDPGAAVLVRLEIAPEDVPAVLGLARHGDRFKVGLVPVRDGVPRLPPSPDPHDGHAKNREAHKLREEKPFVEWALCRLGLDGSAMTWPEQQAAARRLIIEHCGIEHCGQLINNPEACERFEALTAAYKVAHGMTPWQPVRVP